MQGLCPKFTDLSKTDLIQGYLLLFNIILKLYATCYKVAFSITGESMMNFYKIKKEYLDHLRQYDKKVPQNVENGKEKLYTGIVMSTENYNYFVPLSSFNRPQQTNFVLQQNNKRRLGSLRLSFMIPIEKNDTSVLEKVDLDDVDDFKYRRLLEQELKLCRQNQKQIMHRAKKVYDMGNNSEHPRFKDCVQFQKLEQKASEYQYDRTKAQMKKKRKQHDMEL